MTLVYGILKSTNMKIFQMGCFYMASAISKSSLVFGKQSLPRIGAISASFLRTKSNLNDERAKCGENKYSTRPLAGEIIKPDDVDEKITNEVIEAVNNQIQTGTTGRLFAVVQLAARQYKITENDLVLLTGNNPMAIGDRIVLEKILLLGSKDFTLVGHPLLSKDQIRIEATVIEKTLSPVVTLFKMKRRKEYRRMKFFRIPQTVLRINSISLKELSKPDVEGVEGRIF
ncbi:39S ribosomal protein L21, mitochondrial-like isoform X1 [Centruroides sculpturatus]|uniref:39S ribosomal protein L21, mitochondrial-like isoform X1 n=2 Tax=Centruroides sculpturatus TaxID=218467 RepID=UPI000C6DE9CC|nr:39S ribosomal protein L21, mitochondrial-like isoform X1 [Centruroides sculpturatus]XP_023212429.1 39S ribosomal protein L21, mitochondrial-like isoform X1 [Centruroides sculpturatus]